MTIATGSKTETHYVFETVYGETPATPVFQPICISSNTIGLTKDAIEDDCLDSSRQVRGLRHGAVSVAGELASRLEYGAFDDLLEAALMGTWAADVLSTGLVSRSLTVQKYLDLDTDEYHRFTGCKINSVAVSVQPNANVGLTFGIIGQNLDSANLDSLPAGATFAAIGTEVPFDSFTGTLLEGGVAIAIVTGLDFNLENGIEPLPVITSNETAELTEGKSRLTGTLTAYYESKALYEKFINETPSSIDLTLTDPAGNSYQIVLGNVKYTGGNPEISGEGPITISSEFTALAVSPTVNQIEITRTDA